MSRLPSQKTSPPPQTLLSPIHLYEPPPQLSSPPPSQTPQSQRSEQCPNPNSPETIAAILKSVFKDHPHLVPLDGRVDSQLVTKIANEMWQVAFKQGETMENTTIYSAIFSELKLRALAKCNFLPSWWLLREKAMEQMKRAKWVVDDTEMAVLFRDAVEYSLMAMRGGGVVVGEGVENP